MRNVRNLTSSLLAAVLTVATLMMLSLPTQGAAQDAGEAAVDRSATGGASTLEDIMRRQQGLPVDDAARAENIGNPDAAAGISEQLGTLGGASDPDLWRGLRFNAADVTTQVRGPASDVLIQDRGMWWVLFREGPLLTYGGYLLLGTLGALALFFLLRGRVMIDGEKTGRRIERFKNFERFGHWLLAGSFILLGVTGLISLMGRKFLIPVFGLEPYAWIAGYSKWVHNNVSWAFIIALVMIFVMWVVHNFPDKTDLKWLAKGGGLFGGSHPPAKKFNAGQKLIFWSTIVLGGSIAVSGVALLFPFEIQLFAKTFAVLNSTGLPEMLGFGVLPETMTPHEEMQYAQLWHSIVSFVLMSIILAHIYIGSVGMEGAYDAMGTGMVEEQWAKEHHSLWVEEVQKKDSKASGSATPAE